MKEERECGLLSIPNPVESLTYYRYARKDQCLPDFTFLPPSLLLVCEEPISVPVIAVPLSLVPA